MFESHDVSECTARETLSSVGELHVQRNWIDVEILRHALHFADLHPGTATVSDHELVPGGEKSRVYGGSGCPSVKEFAVVEFGVMIGRSSTSAAKYMGQALALRHRLPRTWAQVDSGHATAWKACNIATACRELSEEAAAIVDRRVAGIIDSVGALRLHNIVQAALWEADPITAHARAEEQARERGVWPGRTDNHGTTTLFIKAPTGTIIRIQATINQLANALTALGDTSPLTERRVRALDLLADPTQAADLLQIAHHLTTTNPTAPTPTPDTAETTGTAGTAGTSETPGTPDAPTRPTTSPNPTSPTTPTPADTPTWAYTPAAPASPTTPTPADTPAWLDDPADSAAPATTASADTPAWSDGPADPGSPATPAPADTPARLDASTKAAAPETAATSTAPVDPASPTKPSTAAALVDPTSPTKPATAAAPQTPAGSPAESAGSAAPAEPAGSIGLAGPADASATPSAPPAPQETPSNPVRWPWDETPDTEPPADPATPDPTTPDPLNEASEPHAVDDSPTEASGLNSAERRALNGKLAALNQTARRQAAATTLYLHITDETLLAGEGVARVEGFGPVLVTRLEELIGHGHITLKPVIDLKDNLAVDSYEIPQRIRERIKLKYPAEQFPYGTGESSRAVDLDHIEPYEPGGPPKQTSTDNLIPLRRFSHRVKTRGGWQVHRLNDHALEWTTRYGFKFIVDHNGTHPVDRQ